MEEIESTKGRGAIAGYKPNRISFRFFEWSDNPTSEDDFDEIYNKIWAGEQLKDILKEKE